MNREITVGSKWKHFKGMIAEVLMLAKSADDLRELVVYRHIDNDDIWVRDKDEFLSEVDHKKYSDVDQKYRFEKIKEGE